jgi:hypothetical protein
MGEQSLRFHVEHHKDHKDRDAVERTSNKFHSIPRHGHPIWAQPRWKGYRSNPEQMENHNIILILAQAICTP